MQAAAVNTDLKSAKKQGFTLVEVVVSMVLLGIIFSSAFSTYMLGIDMITDAREELRASQIIHSEIERLRTKNWSDLNQLVDYDTVKPHGEFAALFADKYTAFRYLIDLNTEKDKMLVAVRVEWTNSKGQTSIRWFNTIFVQNGLNEYFYRKA